MTNLERGDHQQQVRNDRDARRDRNHGKQEQLRHRISASAAAPFIQLMRVL
jgi:hypothetical protein